MENYSDNRSSSSVTFTCSCGKTHTENFTSDEYTLDEHQVACSCGKVFGVGKPPIASEYDESEIMVAFHCKECGSMLKATFHKDPDDLEYPDIDQVECVTCDIWYELKLPSLPTLIT